MKNKKNLIFRFALFLLFGIILLILNMYFISAKSLNPNDDNKISFVDDGKTIYFDTTTKTTKEFQAEYKKIGREAILKEHSVLTPQSLVQGRVRSDTAKFLEDPQAEAIAIDMTKNIEDIKSFQKETLPLWEEKTKEISEGYYLEAIAVNDPGDPAKLDDFFNIQGNPYFKSNEVNHYQEYENAIIDYQTNRQNLITKGIIGASDASFPNYFSPTEQNEIRQIMSSQNLVYDQAVVEYLQNEDLLIGGRSLLRSPEFKTISVWKANYGVKDMREEFQKIIY